MSAFTHANHIDINIKRFEVLPESSVDATVRKTIDCLLAEEKAKAEVPASEPNKE